MKLLNFEEWLVEEFAAVGSPPAGNVSGMGNVTAPSAINMGSGDAWPTLCVPYTAVGAPPTAPPAKKRKKRKRKLYKKVHEFRNYEDFVK